MTDLRSLEVDFYLSSLNSRIWVMINGTEIGHLIFQKKQDYIYLKLIDVDVYYQNLGISQTLLKKFGEIYEQNYQNIPIKVDFVNPIAEYAYRKAVSLGYFPDYILNEEYINRQYIEDKIITDLRNKLPKDVRGPESWQ